MYKKIELKLIPKENSEASEGLALTLAVSVSVFLGKGAFD